MKLMRCLRFTPAIAGLLLFNANATSAQEGATDSTAKLYQKDSAVVVATKDSALQLMKPLGKKPHLYRMNYWTTWGFTVAATAGNLYAIPNLIQGKSQITDGEIAGVNRDALNGIERWALKHDPKKAEQIDKSTDYLLQGIILSAATLGFDKGIRKDALRLFTLFAETHAVTFSLYNFSFFGPTFQNKYRPIVYLTEVDDKTRKEGNNKNSMYSGHTASAAASTFFMAKVYNDYHPEFSSGKKYMIYGLAAIPPLVEGYYRVKALKHFPSDVLMGFLIGATCGIAVPEMHRFKRQAVKYSIITTPAGPGFCLTWNPGAKEKTVLD
jgi:membrane-associated phospholipid phosphatase